MANQSLSIQSPSATIKSHARPLCYLCGSQGDVLYNGLEDKLFGAPGFWTLRRCSEINCGLAWLDPMPLAEEIPKAYANYYTHEGSPPPATSLWSRMLRAVKQGYLAGKYGYHQVAQVRWQRILGLLVYFVPRRRAHIDAEVFYLRAKSGGRLLDVGCGSGHTLARMASLGWHVEGVEPDPLALNIAVGKGLRVYQGTLYSQQFATDSFDAVIMNHVIEHVDNPVSLLKECLRILRPGGRLVVLTPNIGSWGHRLYGRHWRGLEPPRHLSIFTLSALSRASALAGFQNCECRSIAQGASYILGASQALSSDSTAPKTRDSLLPRLVVKVMSIGEWAATQIDREAGEEIVLVATK